MSTAILMNPQAGLRNRDKATPERMEALVRELALDAEIVLTESKDHMCNTIRSLQTKGVERIAVAGGDGTAHAAVQCLACTDTVLGIIPQGTRNNFAHALGLPMQLEHSVKVLRDGRPMAVDVGEAFGTFFNEAAGIGLFADALEFYGENNKNIWRGLYAIAKVFFQMRPKRLRLTIDGQMVSEKAVMCTIANSYRIGMAASIAPGASVIDGKLDIVVLGELTRLELVPYYKQIKQRGNTNLSKISRMQGSEIRIEAAIPLAVHVDDHIVGYTPATIRVVPKSLKVMVGGGLEG